MNMYQQKGATLIVALVVLFSMTLLATVSMKVSNVQMMMSGNDADIVSALERAQSVVDVIMENHDNFSVGANINDSNCTSNISGCTSTAINLSGDLFTSLVSEGVSAKITRVGPENVPLPRGLETSAVSYDAVMFSISGNYDERSLGRGKANVTQGVLMLVPRGAQ